MLCWLPILAVWETTAVFGAVAICYAGMLGVVWKVFEHVNHSEKHPDKRDIVFRDVCETKHSGESRTWEAQLDAAKGRIEDLKKQVENGFLEVKRDVCEVKNLLLKSGPKS